jgi:ElaB/YqjD/DUF883 family membrane-anchored ribosome-binding protein
MESPTTTHADTSSRRHASDSPSVQESAANIGSELRSQVRHAYDSTKARASEWTAGFQAGIRNDPIRSVLIAATAGAVLGLILGRRRN